MPAACILDAEGVRLTSDERAFFRAADPWGFILFARNIDTPDQLRALTAEMREAVGREAPVMVDQEGGRVQRLGPPHWRDWLPPLDFVMRAGDWATRAMYLRYRIVADELQAVGIDANCAPVADLARAETHPFLRNRCYGGEPDEVARLARAAAEGHLAGGVLPVMKHLPGHGRAAVDSHAEMPRVDASAEALEDADFETFRQLADLPAGMTAHVVYRAFDDLPATISPDMIGRIRRDIGFAGLLMSDDLRMQALTGSPADRVRAARDAGCDLALYCNEPLAVREAVAEAAGPMGAEALCRAERALAARRRPDAIDIAAAEEELSSLMMGAVNG